LTLQTPVAIKDLEGMLIAIRPVRTVSSRQSCGLTLGQHLSVDTYPSDIRLHW